MYCCINCFADSYLQDYIKENGEIGSCDFCESEDIHCIKATDLSNLFDPVVSLYSIVEDFMPLYDLKNRDGLYLWEKLQYDWGIFGDIDYNVQEDILRTIFPCTDKDVGEPQFLNSWVENQDEYFGTDLEVTDKLKKQWIKFCDELRYSNRYFPENSPNLDLLRELFPILSYKIKKNTYFYRSRITDSTVKFDCSQMSKPPSDLSIDGRANPKGISYLYIASDEKTSIAEIKPSIKDFITVGKFIVKKELDIVDLRNPHINSPFRFGYNLKYFLIHLGFLRLLGLELSKTIHQRKSFFTYLPLQYIYEFIKKEKYDGVAYNSSVADGYNLAIFNDNKLECLNTYLLELELIDFSFKKID